MFKIQYTAVTACYGDKILSFCGIYFTFFILSLTGTTKIWYVIIFQSIYLIKKLKNYDIMI